MTLMSDKNRLGAGGNGVDSLPVTCHIDSLSRIRTGLHDAKRSVVLHG